MDSNIESLQSAPEQHEKRFTFPKSARLRHRTLVNRLFECGGKLYAYPLRLTWRALSPEELADSFRDGVPEGIGPVQMMVTIPKKKRRHAVDRVRMRRIVRECFRLQRGALVDMVESMPQIRTLSISLIYIAETNLDYALVSRKMESLLRKLCRELSPDGKETET